MNDLHVIKIGGDITANESLLHAFLQQFAAEPGLKILLHGGGKSATAMAAKMGLPQTLVDGRRITNAATLDIAVMVYAGLINKQIVARLQGQGYNAIGCSGADAGLVKSVRKAVLGWVDYGFAGDIGPEGVNCEQFVRLLELGMLPVLCSITHDGNGQLLNTNADTMAGAIASGLSHHYNVSLTYCFGKKGVLQDPDDDDSIVPVIDAAQYRFLREAGSISEGMIPKLETAFQALSSGVKAVTIRHALNVHPGTRLVSGIQQHTPA
jgi:acetylglutamate kinase